MRVDGVALEFQRRLAAQLGDEIDHIAFQPLHHLHGDIEEIARAAGRVQNADLAQCLVEAPGGAAGLLALALGDEGLAFHLHIAPVLAQGFDNGGCDQAFHIGARRIMGAQLVALLLVQRLFQQRAENRRLDIAPVAPGGNGQLGDHLRRHRQGAGIPEQAAIEFAHRLADPGIQRRAGIHVRPQLFQCQMRPVGHALQLFEHAGETVLLQKLHILGEHGEEAAHEEHGHRVGAMLLFFQVAGDKGQPRGDVPGDLGRAFGRVQIVGRLPDRTQPVAHGLAVQILQQDAEAAPVREMRVILSLARKVRIDLETIADIADDQERRPAMFRRQVLGIGLGLFARLAHGRDPGIRAAFRRAGLGIAGLDPVQFRLGRVGLGASRLGALLGLQHECAALVEVDETGRDMAVAVMARHRTLENIVVEIIGFGGRIGLGQVQQGAQLIDEGLRVRTLGAAGFLPALDEFRHRVRGDTVVVDLIFHAAPPPRSITG